MFVDGFLHCTKRLKLMDSYLFLFFLPLPEETDSKKILLSLILKSVQPMFSSSFLWFQISHLSLQSFLSLYFVYGIVSDPVSFFCAKLSSFPISFIKDTVFYLLYIIGSTVVHSVQFSCSLVYNSATPWTAARQASLSITNSWSLLKLMCSESVMPSHLLSSLLPSTFPSIRIFSNESVLCIRWPKYWSFSFSISSSNEYSGLISFRIGWLDLLAVRGTLKHLLQRHRSVNSLALSILYSPTLTYIHDY